ncbi:MAG: IS5 family transposase [Candidatus Nitrosocaldaceae archaeon]|nr:MAG: IS5 family transposase [Candidatus Nitrosocaldaceae archaeon]GIU72123.1 MAG: IS5 family transposase [Candidatus Nitrosocaldaceae archaeon]
MNWHDIDERLIKRGEILLSLDFIDNYDKELEELNKHKVGRPYQITNNYAQFLAIIRYMLDIPYRQLEGFTIALNRLIPKLKPVDYSEIRKRLIKLDYKFDIKNDDNKPISIALDSSGVKVHKSYGWIERKHGIKKHYIKIHFAVNINTKEIIDMQITRDDITDSKAALDIMNDIINDKIDKVYADGAYDTLPLYKLLEDNNIEAIIKPRRNARYTNYKDRNDNVRCIKQLGYKQWSKLKGYGKRWMVETVYSSFKRMFNEYCLARSFEYIKKEIITKVCIYNMLINLR